MKEKTRNRLIIIINVIDILFVEKAKNVEKCIIFVTPFVKSEKRMIFLQVIFLNKCIKCKLVMMKRIIV